jgi:hypothetical protein
MICVQVKHSTIAGHGGNGAEGIMDVPTNLSGQPLSCMEKGGSKDHNGLVGPFQPLYRRKQYCERTITITAVFECYFASPQTEH